MREPHGADGDASNLSAIIKLSIVRMLKKQTRIWSDKVLPLACQWGVGWLVSSDECVRSAQCTTLRLFPYGARRTGKGRVTL